MKKEILKIGVKTKFGEICGILWIGERYYLLITKTGIVSLMPASAIEVDY